MNIALLLSGGTGSRMGAGVPKQYLSVWGERIITTVLKTFYSHPEIHALQIAADPAWQAEIQREQEQLPGYKDLFRGFSLPGQTRQLSIQNSLRDISAYAGEEDVILIHDAARPLVSAQLVSDCLTAIEHHDGVMPALPMTDTVYLSYNGKQISGLLNREQVIAGQAPEAFRFGKYVKANEALTPERMLEINGSAEPAILAGMDLVTIPGDPGNFKITTPKDLEQYRAIRRQQAGIKELAPEEGQLRKNAKITICQQMSQ